MDVVRTFCNANNITISDFYAFAHVIHELLKLSNYQKRKLGHVIRLVDHIQNLNGMREQIDRLKFKVNLPAEPLLLEPKLSSNEDTNLLKPTNESENSKKSENLKDNKDKGGGIYIFILIWFIFFA